MVVAVREERDPAFWQRVIDHPAVRHVAHGQALDIAALVGHERVTPLASEHGGFVFIQIDGLGRVYEMHTLFEPEGWGREVYGAAASAFLTMFGQGADLVVTYETEHPQSRAPRSFGFRPIGEFRSSSLGEVRTWVLTREAWNQSPVRRRACQ